MKDYPINIFGVKKYGVEEWLRNYWAPVTGKEYQAIYEGILSSYICELNALQDTTAYWIAISNIKIAIFVSMHIFNSLKLLRLRELGFTHVTGKTKESIAEKINSPVDFSIFKLIDGHAFDNLFLENVKDLLRTIKYNWRETVDINFHKNFLAPHFFAGSRTNKLIVSYCHEKGISPVQIFPMFFGRNALSRSNIKKELDLMKEFTCAFLDRAIKLHPAIKSLKAKGLQDALVNCFKHSLFFFHNSLFFLKHVKKKTLPLLMDTIGHSTQRLFCSAWRYSGGEAIGFVHGNGYCTPYRPTGVTDGYISVLNQYVASTKGQRDLLERAARDFSLGLEMDVVFSHAKTNFYYPLFEKLQKGPPVRSIKKVMIIGFPMNEQMYPWFPEGHALSRLQLELRVVKLLKKSGYYVIYKAHPDRLAEVKGIFEGYADKVLTSERFEAVYSMADCVLFSHAYTTTFGFALLTRLPVVLFVTKGESWFPRAFDLLNKRVSVVGATPDDSGSLNFDEKELLSAIEKSAHNINYEILEEFAF